MRALYFPYVPQDVDGDKSAAPERQTIMGAPVYASGVFQALIKHSTFERIVLPDLGRPARSDLRDSSLFRENRHRLIALGEHQLSRLQEYERVVFLSPGMALPMLSRLRRVSGCPNAPVTGMIQSINYTFQLQAIWMMIIAPLFAHDALMCPSVAGRQGIENFIEVIRGRMADARLPLPSPLFKLPVVPMGVDADAFSRASNPSALRTELGLGPGPVLLYLGRLSATSKGDLFPLIVAFRAVQERHPQASLVIAGDDTHFRMADALQKFAAWIAPAAIVRIVANPTDAVKKQLYAAADVFVSPSDSLQETFGITIAEAMAAGLPTVVSDWNGYKDLVVHGETGFRVRTVLPRYPACFDDLRGTGGMTKPDLIAATTVVDVTELTEAVCALVGDSDKRRAMGDAACARAKALYDWRVVIKACEALWNELAQEAETTRSSAATVWPDLQQFGYHEIFAHYPTESIGEEGHVQLSAAMREVPIDNKWLTATIASAGWFRPELFGRIVDTIQQRQRLKIGTLLDQLGATSDVDRLTILTHLFRLVKYGIVAAER